MASRPKMRTKNSQAALALLLACGVCLSAVLLYWPSLSQPLQFDDQLFLRDDNVRLGRWRPFVSPPVPRLLTWLTFLLQYQVNGSSAPAYHAVDLVIHSINSVLVFLFLALMTAKGGGARDNSVGPRFGDAQSLTAAAVGSALFAVHPVQTETVLLVYQRSTLLATLFSCLSLLCWLYPKGRREASRDRGATSILAGVFFLLAVAAKETAVVVPILFWVLDGLFDGRWRPSARLWVLVGLGGALGLGIAFEGAESGQVATGRGLAGALVYAATQIRVIWLYLGLVAGVGSLNVDHHVPAQHTPWDPTWGLAAAGLVALLWIFWRMRRRCPAVTFHGLAFFLFLLPSSSLIPSPDFAFEHRVYSSMLGVAGLASVASLALFKRMAEMGGASSAKRKWLAAGSVLLPCAGLVVMVGWARERIGVWDHPVALWRDAVAKSPNKYRPNFNLGVLLLEEEPEEADIYLSRAIQIDPSQPLAYRSLGEARLREGAAGDAESLWKQALLLNPKDFDTLLALGKLDRGKHRYFEAKRYLEAAESLRPEDWEVHFQLGKLHEEFGFVAESVAFLERALELNPAFPALYFALAEPMTRTNNWDRAAELYQQGLALSPDDANAHYRLAQIYWRMGREADARAEVEKGMAAAKGESEIETGRALLDAH